MLSVEVEKDLKVPWLSWDMLQIRRYFHLFLCLLM